MTAELAVLAADPTSLDVFDDPGKQIELACQRANAWLKAGIDVRIETIVETKAQAAALAAFAIQKQLGHDAELAALEVQRRAERGVALAIRRGQETGEIRSRGVHQKTTDAEVLPAASPYDFASHGELYGDGREGGNGAYAMTDGVSDDQFDSALEEAKAEGNLSRANVVRKVKGEKSKTLTTAQKIDRIRDLASRGYHSAQIARELGYTDTSGDKHVRKLANENGIDLPADKASVAPRRIDSNKVAAEIVATLEGLALPMRLVNFDKLDAAQVNEWANSLTESMRALNRFVKQIKELAQ